MNIYGILSSAPPAHARPAHRRQSEVGCKSRAVIVTAESPTSRIQEASRPVAWLTGVQTAAGHQLPERDALWGEVAMLKDKVKADNHR